MVAENDTPPDRKQIRVVQGNLAADQNAPGKDTRDDKSKAAPAADQPATQPDKTPAEVASEFKSWQLKQSRRGPLRDRSIGR